MSRALIAALMLLPLSSSAAPPASAVPNAPGSAAPPSWAATLELFRQPGAMDHIKIYAVDEKCLAAKDVLNKSPSGTAGEATTIGDDKTAHLTFQLHEEGADTAAAFPGFKTWANKRFAKGKRILVYGVDMMAGTQYGYKAFCVDKTPLLAPTDVGHVVNKLDPEIDKKDYRVVFKGTALAKIKKLRPSVLRLAFVYDDDLLVAFVNTSMLREFDGSSAVLNLISFHE